MPIIEKNFSSVSEAWQRAGGDGRPQFVLGGYFALGDAVEEARNLLLRGYAPAGAEFAERMANSIVTDADAMRSSIAELESIGVDELFMWSPTTSQDQIELQAEALAS